MSYNCHSDMGTVSLLTVIVMVMDNWN